MAYANVKVYAPAPGPKKAYWAVAKAITPNGKVCTLYLAMQFAPTPAKAKVLMHQAPANMQYYSNWVKQGCHVRTIKW